MFTSPVSKAGQEHNHTVLTGWPFERIGYCTCDFSQTLGFSTEVSAGDDVFELPQAIPTSGLPCGGYVRILDA